MTNSELNKAIAEGLGWQVDETYFEHDLILVVKDQEKSNTGYNFDFNNWNDLMPLVVEHGLHIQSKDPLDSKDWFEVHSYDYKLVANNENPQRALAECLLKVLQSK